MKLELEKLLKDLEQQIDFLANTNIIPGMEIDDVRQEMRLLIMTEYAKIPIEKLDNYNLGWWFMRLKWSMINLGNKERKEPVNNSFRFNQQAEE